MHIISQIKVGVERMKTVMLRFYQTINRCKCNGNSGAPVNYFCVNICRCFFLSGPKSGNSTCDSITYINGKDSDLCNGFMKSYQQDIVNMQMDFPHSNDAYYSANT